MMTAKYPPTNPVSIREFTASKQAGFFDTLKQPRFSGQLVLTTPKNEKWYFYLYLGRIMYATGGTHPIRRWRRNIALYLPKIAPHLSSMQQLGLASLSPKDTQLCWEYYLLCLWVEQQKITREQVARLIRSTLVEVLFDITQVMEVMCEFKQENCLSTRLVLIDAEQVIEEAQKQWQEWQGAKIADRSPNTAPIIRQPEQLQQRTSAQVYQTLNQLLDGRQTLRDLAVRMKRDVLTVTRSLLPYIQMGLVELMPVDDLPSPVTPPPVDNVPTTETQATALIACVDDSPMMCQRMEQILTEANFQFIGINDPMRAIAIILARKPDLIFLDLVMPNANGYEICAQLRKIKYFRQTPIVILTGNDGIIDRVRAKMVGSSDYITKPVDPDQVINTIHKHLKQETLI
ncbi:MAG: response regulator [Microcystaceae cyanobacterium]